MEDTLMIKSFLEIGVAGGIAFYLLSKTTDALKNLSESVNKLTERIDKLDTRMDYFEQVLSDKVKRR